MAGPNPKQHVAKLVLQTAANQAELIPYLLKARARVEQDIIRAARLRRFATSARIRDGLYLDLSREYKRLGGDVDAWAKKATAKTAKEWYQLGIDDIKSTGEDIAVANWGKFSEAHVQEYFQRIHPLNAEKLAAVNVLDNPNLVRMAESDIRQLRNQVVEVFREGAFSNQTAREIQMELQRRVIGEASRLKSWEFIAANGWTWKQGNYFNMLNRTLTASVARDAYNDTLIDSGRDLVQIIGGLSANSHPACIAYQGKIVSLSGATRGYPTLADYELEGGFHPNCVHSTAYVSPDFGPHKKMVEEQKGQPAPVVKKPKPKAKKSVKAGGDALTKAAKQAPTTLPAEAAKSPGTKDLTT